MAYRLHCVLYKEPIELIDGTIHHLPVMETEDFTDLLSLKQSLWHGVDEAAWVEIIDD